MASLFEDFTKWHPVFSAGKVILANSKAKKFDHDKDRQRATHILVELLKEGGLDEEAAMQQAAVFQKDCEEKDVKGMGEASIEAYEPRMKRLFTTDFSDFYDSAPKGVHEDAYSLLEHVHPIKNLNSLSGDVKKAAELHQNIAGIAVKLQKYKRSGGEGAEAKDIEKEIKEKLFDYYDRKFLNSPERKATFGKMVDVLKKWAKKKPVRAIQVYAQIYEKDKEKFQELITIKELKDYLTVAVDANEIRKLYASADRMYESSQARKRIEDNSDLLPIFSEAA